MKKTLLQLKQFSDENPLFVPYVCNTVAITALLVAMVKTEQNSRAALRASVIALKVALHEDLT